MFGLHLGWRLAMLSGVPIAIVVLYLRQFIPESPRWLLTHSRFGEAGEIIGGIERDVAAQHGALPLVTSTVILQGRPPNTLSKVGLLFSRRHWGRAVLCLGLTMAQSFFYNSVFFQAR